MDPTARAEITVDGVVQGVGFRPFVSRTAAAYDLAGWVRNRGDAGVSIVLEGDQQAIDRFLETLRTDPPPLASIEAMAVDSGPPKGLTEFEIRESTETSGSAGTIPPDTGMCDACLADMRDPDSRYHRYWATSCVDCGPRYTVIRDLPYDRPRTSMDAFPMCEACREEYEDPGDRRFHAQTIACPGCGPRLQYEPEAGNQTETGDGALDRAVTELQAGEILAVKGIGGTHLVCDATNHAAVERLRDRSNRSRKPFALMAPDLDRIDAFASVTDTERAELERVRRPIVLLEKKQADWLEPVAPTLHTVGVMLPYAGLHHLLFESIDSPLVVTSANLPGEPMATTRSAIWAELGDIIDGALLHDRDIVMRTDDSVVRVVDGTATFIRRSRGWVPQPLPRFAADKPADPPSVLAMGAQYDTTVAVTRADDIVPSQHIGDVDGPATRRFHRETVAHLTELLGIDPSIVACDMHPDFVTTAEANERAAAGLEGPIEVQHHHAHAVSLLGEHELEKAVVVTADGTGYGPDGSIWGGEVLAVTRDSFERVGGLGAFALPGGEAAVLRPARILASLLQDSDRIDELLVSRGAVETPSQARTVRKQVEQDVNAPWSTSAGRFLDAISALLGIVTERSYEGEPAMALEAVAHDGEPIEGPVPFDSRDGNRTLDVRALTRRLDDLRESHSKAAVAATAQDRLARGLGKIAVETATERGIEGVGFSGGVAYNEAITRTLRQVVEDAGLTFLDHDLVPPGDAGIAYGQAIVATSRAVSEDRFNA